MGQGKGGIKRNKVRVAVDQDGIEVAANSQTVDFGVMGLGPAAGHYTQFPQECSSLQQVQHSFENIRLREF